MESNYIWNEIVWFSENTGKKPFRIINIGTLCYVNHLASLNLTEDTTQRGAEAMEKKSDAYSSFFTFSCKLQLIDISGFK